MSEDDLGGYLMDAIRAATAKGLTGLTLWRVGTKPMWQASSRWSDRSGYSVHIEATPAEALTAALEASRTPAPSVSSASVAPQPEEQDIFA